MGKRGELNQADVLRVMRHLADVAALKGNPPAQRQLLVDGLNALLGTDAGFFYVADEWRPGRRPHFSSYTLSTEDRKSTRLNSSHSQISYAVFCLKKKTKQKKEIPRYAKADLGAARRLPPSRSGPIAARAVRPVRSVHYGAGFRSERRAQQPRTTA